VPRKGSKIQNKTSSHYRNFSSYLKDKPRVVRLLLKPPSSISHKTIRKTAHLGKRARKKTTK
jgi:hypothetical protein